MQSIGKHCSLPKKKIREWGNDVVVKKPLSFLWHESILVSLQVFVL